jgi:hypothetical protein
MRPDSRVRPLLVLLAASVALLTTVQCVPLFAIVASRIPSLENVSYAPAPHTREEVGDRGVDLSVDARSECTRLSIIESAPASIRSEFVDAVAAEVTPPLRILHRRVFPSSPDDAFPSFLR